MAYTKIHAVKATVHKAIAYICNPDKTDGSILISSFGCSPETAHFDFKFALSKTSRNDENKAYHLIQSFLPGEVDFDTAHQIGMELADRVLEGKYSYVVSTHIDRDHIHNHIIFCAADNLDHHKYNDCKKSYYRIRQLSDELCKEHHLSVIVPGKERGKKYNEWSADRQGDSRKTELRRDINSAIRAADTYDEFLYLLRAKGYVVKGENLDGKPPKYISFLPPGRERFVRGSLKSLGKEYTKERISERIAERVQSRGKTLSGSALKRLIDTSQEKFQESAGLRRWAEIENLKTAASAYSKVSSIADLEQRIAEQSALSRESRERRNALERRMKSMAEIIKYAEQYKANRAYNTAYRKSGNPDEYFRRHETQLILYDGAKEMLRRAKIDPKALDLDKLRADFSKMELQKKELLQACQSAEKEVWQMEREREKLEQYLSAEQADVSSQEHRKEPSR